MTESCKVRKSFVASRGCKSRHTRDIFQILRGVLESNHPSSFSLNCFTFLRRNILNSVIKNSCKVNQGLMFAVSHLALYFTTPPGKIIIMMLSVVTLWKLPCLALTKYVSGIQIRSITVLLRNMVLLSP